MDGHLPSSHPPAQLSPQPSRDRDLVRLAELLDWLLYEIRDHRHYLAGASSAEMTALVRAGQVET